MTPQARNPGPALPNQGTSVRSIVEAITPQPGSLCSLWAGGDRIYGVLVDVMNGQVLAAWLVLGANAGLHGFEDKKTAAAATLAAAAL